MSTPTTSDITIINGTTGKDVLGGSDGHDILKGDDGWDLMYGYDGNDTIIGGEGDDTLYGGDGDDTYEWRKGDGNDTIASNRDNGDNDTLHLVDVTKEEVSFSLTPNGTAAHLNIHVGEEKIALFQHYNNGRANANHTETLRFSDGSVIQLDENISFAGAGHIYGLHGDNGITGSAGADWIYERTGNDTIIGGEGDDKLYGDEGDDTYEWRKGDGNDTIHERYDNGGNDTLHLVDVTKEEVSFSLTPNGTAAHLNIHVGEEKIALFQHYNNGRANANYTETLRFSDGSVIQLDENIAFAGTGNDTIIGGKGDDYLYGEDGNDSLHGDGGNDALYGGDGNDTINGQHDNDSIHGDAGDDSIIGWTGHDKLSGADGNDFILAGSGDDSASGGHGNDYISGHNGNDTLLGEHGQDTLLGGAGNDSVSGGDGNDVLRGDDGDDLLIGGNGRDVMQGGTGADVFDYNTLSESSLSAVDLIQDFEIGIDTLDLSNIGMFSGLDTDGGRTENGELRLSYSAATDRTYIRSDQLDFSIALVDGDYRATLTDADFIFA